MRHNSPDHWRKSYVHETHQSNFCPRPGPGPCRTTSAGILRLISPTTATSPTRSTVSLAALISSRIYIATSQRNLHRCDVSCARPTGPKSQFASMLLAYRPPFAPPVHAPKSKSELGLAGTEVVEHLFCLPETRLAGALRHSRPLVLQRALSQAFDQGYSLLRPLKVDDDSHRAIPPRARNRRHQPSRSPAIQLPCFSREYPWSAWALVRHEKAPAVWRPPSASLPICSPPLHP